MKLETRAGFSMSSHMSGIVQPIFRWTLERSTVDEEE